jgi:hypothetical protein
MHNEGNYQIKQAIKVKSVASTGILTNSSELMSKVALDYSTSWCSANFRRLYNLVTLILLLV